MIWKIDDVAIDDETMIGGKAGTLARLAQDGYAAPDGFVITSEAFDGERLSDDAWETARRHAAELGGPFAVCSSARAEDSATASFAGEFETVLNVEGEAALREAIEAVYHSRHSARVVAYAEAQQMDTVQEMNVLVQRMVPATLAGVLFTADAVSGNRARMMGNFVSGLGDRLVSGDVSGERFTLSRPKGAYEGPPALRPYARKLFKLGRRLERDLGGPQDVEWAVAGGKLWLLQSRPISTMQAYDVRTGMWNDSRTGDYLWSNANFGEALPEVMTPLTWSLVQIYFDETFGNPLPGDHRLAGNIGGRLYVNLSLFASMMKALGFSRERMNSETEEFFGNLPEDVDVPLIPFSRLDVLRSFVPFALRAVGRRALNTRRLPSFLSGVTERVRVLEAAVKATESPQDLGALWREEFEPFLRSTFQMLQVATSRYENSYRPLRRKLLAQVGEEEANLLLSSVSADGEELESLGPLLGLWRVQNGQMSREAYLERYGHRGANEFEVSWPRPVEDAQWLDSQLAMVAEMDVPALLARREAQKKAAWARYEDRIPKEAAGVERDLAAAAEAARTREAVRSETTRLMSVARTFALRAGALTGLHDDVFFLRLAELLRVLESAEAPASQLERRRSAYERLSNLPPYPALINGRFNP
ncbi:MAG: PEP/pyruvate-binding domain-containing protein, partial [Chloroflexota bacterium]